MICVGSRWFSYRQAFLRIRKVVLFVTRKSGCQIKGIFAVLYILLLMWY